MVMVDSPGTLTDDCVGIGENLTDERIKAMSNRTSASLLQALLPLALAATSIFSGCGAQGGPAQRTSHEASVTLAPSSPAAPAPRCSYEANVLLDPSGQSASSTTAIAYRNDGPSAIDELVFHFKPAAGEAPQFSMNGQPIKAVPWTRDGKAVEDHILIKLSKPLSTGQSVHMQARSRALMVDEYGIKSLSGCWHPKVLYRANDQWTTGLDEFASYRVTVGPVNRQTIPMSGTILASKLQANGHWMLTSTAGNVPDFAMVFTKADEVVSARQDGVLIQVFYVKDKDLAERMLKIACDVVAFYHGKYGFYPDNVLNILAFDGQGFGGGPIGSNIVFVNNTFHLSADNTAWGVAHEIGHEYWGWNQVINGNPGTEWLCLGMGLWTDRQYMTVKGIDGQDGNILDQYIQAAKQGMNTRLEALQPQDRSNRMDQNPLDHGKGYCIAQMLEYVCGKEARWKTARATLTQHAHQPVGSADFQKICEEASGQKLNWFFRQWTQTNGVLDYAVDSVKAEGTGAGRKIAVAVKPKGISMPIDVMTEFADGSKSVQRLPVDAHECVFASDQGWRRVILDPSMTLPDLDRHDNVKVNPEAPPAFEVLQIDTGDKAWGLNVLKVHVKNTLNVKRQIYIHIGGRPGKGQLGFGQGKGYEIPPGQDMHIEHWYWIPPSHGTGTVKVSFTDPVTDEPQYEEPFLVKTEELAFAIPNYKCNNLDINAKLPRDRYKGMRHLDAFKVFTSDHFVIYCSPDTPAFPDIRKIIATRETALKALCDFAGTAPKDKIIVFFYPDQQTKFMCTIHTGDGMARGNTLAEVYNEKTKLDPSHELAHILMSQLGGPPAMFNEGFATWSQAGRIWNDKQVDTTARELIKAGRLVPLTKLLTREEIGSQSDDGEIAYPESASFVGFLIDTHGKEKFLSVYAQLVNGSDEKQLTENLRLIRNVFGQSLAELETQWLDHLKAQPANNPSK